jgi:hypothetical protein
MGHGLSKGYSLRKRTTVSTQHSQQWGLWHTCQVNRVRAGTNSIHTAFDYVTSFMNCHKQLNIFRQNSSRIKVFFLLNEKKNFENVTRKITDKL